MNYDEFFNTLASDNSRLFKESYLTQYKDDETLKQIISMALDPFLQFHIRKIPQYTPNLTDHAASINFGLKELVVLSSREKTGNAGIEHLSNLLSAVSDHAAKVLIRIIEKDLNCGVSAATVNKIWPKLISEYPVMLCSQFEDKLVDKLDWPAYAQCLSENCKVETNVGVMSIKDICLSDRDIFVKSFNHLTNNVELKPVIGKSITQQQKDTEWFILKINGKFTEPLTGNHLVWCENKQIYARVDTLSTNDTIRLLQ